MKAFRVGFPAKSPQGRWSHDGRCVGCSSGGDPYEGNDRPQGADSFPCRSANLLWGTTLIPTADEFLGPYLSGTAMTSPRSPASRLGRRCSSQLHRDRIAHAGPDRWR